MGGTSIGVPGCEGGDRLPAVDADGKMQEASERIIRVCSLLQLSGTEAADVAQEVFLWLFRRGTPVQAVSTPWLSGVAKNFALRYRREMARRRFVEEHSAEIEPDAPETAPLSALESNELLRRMATKLPEPERSLLALVRQGHTPAAAARMLDIPCGSADYHYRRIVARGQQLVHPTSAATTPSTNTRPASQSGSI